MFCWTVLIWKMISDWPLCDITKGYAARGSKEWTPVVVFFNIVIVSRLLLKGKIYKEKFLT